MEISTQEYLYLIEQIKILKEESKVMTKENILFSDQIVRQREQIALLEKQLQQFKDKSNEKQQEMKQHITNQKNQMIEKMFSIHEEQKNFVLQEFLQLKEGGAVKRMLEMEKQLADNRKKNMDSFKYHEFHQQVKMIYQSQNKKKAEPTIPDLLKWIRQKKSKDGKQNLSTSNIPQNLQQSISGTRPPRNPKRQTSQAKQQSRKLVQPKESEVLVESQILPEPSSERVDGTEIRPTDSETFVERNISESRSSRVNIQV